MRRAVAGRSGLARWAFLVLAASALLGGCQQRLISGPKLPAQYDRGWSKGQPLIWILLPDQSRFELLWATGMLNPRGLIIYSGTWTREGANIILSVTKKEREVEHNGRSAQEISPFDVVGTCSWDNGRINVISIDEPGALGASAKGKYWLAER